MKIKGFSNYEILSDGSIINLLNKKTIKESKNLKCNGSYFKLKNDEGFWKSMSKSKILSLSEEFFVPEGFVEIPTFKGYYINKLGEVISTSVYKRGNKLKIQYPKNSKQYPYVNICGNISFIHQLLAITFIDKNYIEKGLVAMHIDNNKRNHTLENIKIGTYSENNKQAYDDGLNIGNKSNRRVCVSELNDL